MLESELRLRLAINAANIGVWDWNYQHNTFNYSPEWKRQLGYDDQEISNRYFEWENRLHPDDKQKAVIAILNFIKNQSAEYAINFRLQHKNGSYRWIHSRGQAVERDNNGKATRVLGCHIDITQLKESEEELKTFHWFAESAGQGRAMATFDGTIKYINPSLLKIVSYLGLNSQELNLFNSFYAEESASMLNKVILPALFNNGKWLGELDLGSGSSRRTPTLNDFFAVRDEDGKPQYIANIITDVSQQKEIEKQLLNAKLARNRPTAPNLYSLPACRTNYVRR
ncbi:MAG: PAS domain S-box protein [Gammaproteobacteria bacterium]|nr:PAS domain S-box protein [Gammaproteobacteria bacterium]